jgi:hypothetical protein
MSIKELKTKATAAEACLIDAVVSAVEDSTRREILVKLERFIVEYPPPCMDDIRHDQSIMKRWGGRLVDELKKPSQQS